ncbi:MAG: recombinase family protein [Clostridiales bacterium]|nr:recombinase family protein [Clostridiales bacterium]
MARTANRYLPTVKKKRWLAGNYVRLSVDSAYTGSDSIQNQILLGKAFEREHAEIEIVNVYIDNGATGTNFIRDEFEQMIQDVKTGSINCIIVKDLSRFGRDHLDAGDYIEKVFPFLGVRFISINDKYDSEDAYCDQEVLEMHLKNLVHEIYARDFSMKVSAVYEMKQKKGIFYRSSKIPYGYIQDKESKGYCIDEQAAQIVKQIFSWCREGKTVYSITMKLTEMKVCTPTQYKMTGKIYREEKEQILPWYQSTVLRILTNDIYLGNAVRHKTEQRYCYGITEHKVAKDHQVVIKDVCEALISEEEYSAVQQILEERAERSKNKERTTSSIIQYAEENMLKGMIFCGDCKSVMSSTYLKSGEKYIKGYMCAAHKQYKGLCDSKKIDEIVLYGLIKKAIQNQIRLLKNVKKKIQTNTELAFEKKKCSINKEERKLDQQGLQLKQCYLRYFERYSEGEIGEKEFQEFRKQYLEKKKQIKLGKKNLEQKKTDMTHMECALKRMATEWLRYDGFSKLDENVIESFVNRVEIYADNRVEIIFHFADEFLKLGKYTRKGEL